jgi:hypothetical protein
MSDCLLVAISTVYRHDSTIARSQIYLSAGRLRAVLLASLGRATSRHPTNPNDQQRLTMRCREQLRAVMPAAPAAFAPSMSTAAVMPSLRCL